MPMSPLDDAEGAVRVSVLCNGTPVDERARVISVTVRRAVNRVPSATLVFMDGDMPTQGFELSDGADFKPGAEIVVKAGYGENDEPIFQGVVVRHGLKIAGGNEATLVVECRDKAIKMTVGRKNALWENQTDADVMRALVSAHGLSVNAQATSVTHGASVQHYCSDWDYLLTRAEANGLLVVAEDGVLGVAAPDVSAAAALRIAWGESLIDFQADIDARHQYSSVTARGWDLKQHALQEGSAASPDALSAQGDLTAAALAEVLNLSDFALQSGAPLTQAELTGWARAQQLKSALARVQGRVRFQGSALAKVGKLIELAGVGARFNGKVLVTGLVHRIEQGAWSTEAEFGSPVEWFAERGDIVAPAAAGRVPGIEGLHAGIVLKLDADPENEHRVQLAVPAAGIDRVWARLAQFHASKAFGAFFVPEVGDEVLVGWFGNDPVYPVVLGSLYSSKNAPPYGLTAENDVKAIVTRSQVKIEINDKDKVVTITTPGKNQLVFSDKDKSITITDEHQNKIEMASGGITLDSPKDIQLTAKGKITLDAVGEVSVSSKVDVKVAGLNVNCTAKVGLVAKGSATAELSAAGQTTVKGALVMIN